VDIDRLIAAGLYDPDAPDAEDRLGLLRYVSDSGATIDEMLAAVATGGLTSLVLDHDLNRGPLAAVDVAERSGTPLDVVLETYRLLGVDVPDPRQAIFDEREVRLLEILDMAMGSLPAGLSEEILRAIGSALTIVAESAVSVFVGSVEDLIDQQGGQLHRAEMTTATGGLALELGELLGPLLRHHLWAAVSRQRAAMITSRDRLDTLLSIGFVDLVGFTSASAAMDSVELLEFMREFHSRAFDLVTGRGGRVVKHIGDEIMFAVLDPTMACDIGLALIEAFGVAGSHPRGGVAHGAVIARHGDFYGTVVNLASRLVDAAVPGELLADADIAPLVSGGESPFVVEPAGRRLLKGFAEPVAVVSITRAVH
jgi:adenylate cyclase